MLAGGLRLALVLISVVLLSGIPCFGYCTPTLSADDNLPPCHRHHQAPTHQASAPCCHDFLPSGASQAPAVVPVPVDFVPMAVVSIALAARGTSIPDLALPPFSVLRI